MLNHLEMESQLEWKKVFSLCVYHMTGYFIRLNSECTVLNLISTLIIILCSYILWLVAVQNLGLNLNELLYNNLHLMKIIITCSMVRLFNVNIFNQLQLYSYCHARV